MAQYSVWLTIQTEDNSDQGPATIASSIASAVDSELMVGMRLTSLHVDRDEVEVSEAHV